MELIRKRREELHPPVAVKVELREKLSLRNLLEFHKSAESVNSNEFPEY
jgi:hypothetical protein